MTALKASTAAARLAETVSAFRSGTPLVHCITNTVVQNVTANVLLAAGGAPAMVDHPVEAPQFAGIASGVLINVGTIAPSQAEAMPLAAKAAHDAGVPWVLDPVAVGALTIRTEMANELLQYGPAVIRGNASEIAALAGAGAGGRGVDSTDSVEGVLEAAFALAERTGAVVAVSGERDVIVWAADGSRHALWLTSGHELMPRVIGTGCALGAVIAGYVGAARSAEIEGVNEKDKTVLAVLTAHAHMGAAGTRAGEKADRPGSFAVAWIDALDELSGEDVAALVSVEDAQA